MRHRQGRRTPPLGSLGAVGVVALLVLLWSSTSGTLAGWTSGVVVNDTGAAAAGSLAFSHTYGGGTTCSLGPRVSASTACAGTIAPVGSAPATRTDAIANTGTARSTSLATSVRIPSCAPVKLDDAVATSDPLAARVGTAFQQADPWGTTSAAGLSGSGYASEVVATNTGALLGASYSVGVWFKVANGYATGGGLMGLTASWASATSAAASPALWMDNAGRIRFRVTGTLGGSSSGVSTASYNNGGWHLAVLSVTGLGITLLVDGASVATAGSLTALTGSSAYWHVGWADFTGITGTGVPPTTPFLTGSLSGAWVRAASTTTAEAATMTGRASAATYRSGVLALSGISHLWMLGDTGTTTYTGTLPGSIAPCAMLDVTWTFTNPSTTLSATLAALADNVARTVSPPDAGTTQTSVLGTARNASYTATAAGLLLRAPISHLVATTPASAWSLTFGWSDASTPFVV